MKKQTKVLVAATLLTLGASFSALAASKGTWVLNDEGWQYADKDGEYVESQWCKSNGVDFWINDDEVLGSNEWVTEEVEVNGVEETRVYYVQSDGSKTIDAWKYLYDMNDEDEEGDEYWFYFDAKGRMLKNTSKKISGQTYYFDADGHMLTGWVDATRKDEVSDATGVADLVYADDNGAVVKSAWINAFPFDEEDGYEGVDEQWFYTDKNGFLTVNDDAKVDGLTYIFDANGYMLTGWVAEEFDGDFVAAETLNSADVKNAYYCDDDYGYVKKNGWRELENLDEEAEEHWYHFDKLGRVFRATSSDAMYAKAVDFVDGEENILTPATTAVLVNSKKIDGVVYYFNADGEMIDGFQAITDSNASAVGSYVYLKDGARYTGKITLSDNNENDYTFYFGEKNDGVAKKYEAVTGNYKNYLYINGQLITSEDSDSYKAVDFNNNGTIGAGDYIVNDAGKVQHKDNKDYGVGKFTFTDEDVIATVVQ